MNRRAFLTASASLSAGLAGCSGASADEFNRQEIQNLVHERVNQRRQNNSLPALDYSGELEADAFAYSKDMAQRGFFGHENPEGEGPQEHTAVQCAVGENIFQTWAGEPFETEEGEPVEHETEADVAEGAVGWWMDSPPHRRNILLARYSVEGVGVYIEDGGKTFVTQLFC